MRRSGSVDDGDAQAREAAGAGAPVLVLICDDAATVRSALRDVLALSPWMSVIGEAANGEEAVRAAAAFQPDVILLDLQMPVRSGLEALPELRKAAPAAKIVVFSDGFGHAQALALGADVAVVKGAPIEEILEAVGGYRARDVVEVEADG